MAKITARRIHPLKRMPMYPTNGLMPTLHMVKLEGSKCWRRVYERYETKAHWPAGSKQGFIPVVKDDNEMRDLTAVERRHIGYRLDV
jgi:hypothetical protein